MADYDWNVIRAGYVAEGKSLKKLCDEHGVSYRQISTVAKDQGWRPERAAYREKIAQKVVDMAADRKAQSISNVMTAADKLAARMVADVDALDGARDIADAAKALKYAADTLAQVYGIQTPAQIHRQRMDEEKLKLEKRRLEMEEKKQDAASNPPAIRVVIERPDGEDELDG